MAKHACVILPSPVKTFLQFIFTSFHEDFIRIFYHNVHEITPIYCKRLFGICLFSHLQFFVISVHMHVVGKMLRL